jgi:hypothetical protein
MVKQAKSTAKNASFPQFFEGDFRRFSYRACGQQGCCADAASGQATAVPIRLPINSRRLM